MRIYDVALENCPFCNHDADINNAYVSFLEVEYVADYCCNTCGCQLMAAGKTAGEALDNLVKKWNCRKCDEQASLYPTKDFYANDWIFS